MLRIRSIRGHLLLYALALALPILLMSGIIGWAYLRQEASRIESLAERQATQVASAIDNRLEAYRATLNVLSVDPEILEGDVTNLKNRVEQMRIPPDIWFTIRGRGGQQLFNSALPEGEELPTFPGRGDAIVFQDGKPFTSNLIWAPATKQWAVTLSVPVRVPAVTGPVQYALSIGVPATHLQTLLADMPPGWIAAINDRDGTILARSLSHVEWVGKPMASKARDLTRDVPPGQGGIWRDIYTPTTYRPDGLNAVLTIPLDVHDRLQS